MEPVRNLPGGNAVTATPSATGSPNQGCELSWPAPGTCWRIGSATQSAASAYPYGYSSKRVRAVAREIGYLHAAVVANAAPSSCDPFYVPRLTIRRSTSLAAFARVAHQQRIRVHYGPAHALTGGWAVVRRTRSALRTLTNDRSSSTISTEGFS